MPGWDTRKKQEGYAWKFGRNLALERAGELEEGGGLPRGVSVKKEHRHGTEATVVTVSSKAGEGAIGKPKGTYVTVD